MCGICAVVGKEGFSAINQLHITKQLQCMNGFMKQRGPDATGLHVEDGVGLGMTRLAIVGGDNGKQPISNEDGTITLVCNGEIYNYLSLRERLEKMGHRFATKSDVEVIVHLYEVYGMDCLAYMEGIFSFALWDNTLQTLFAARDRCGVKPLYYTESSRYITLSSQFAALIAQGGKKSVVDAAGLAAYHAFRFCPGPETIVQGIKKVNAGEYLTIHRGNIRTTTYWLPHITQRRTDKLPQQVKINGLQRSFVEAVRSQVAPGVHSGLLLSGGLDSSALLALNQHVFGEVPDTFTVGFEPPRSAPNRAEYNEFIEAKQVADAYGSHHTSAHFGAREVFTALPSIIAALDEPIADPTAIPLWFAIQLAQQHGAKVVYSGEGVDELFNGYDVYRKAQWLNALHMLPTGLRRRGASFAQRFKFPGAGVLQASIEPLSEWYQGVGGVFSAKDGHVFTHDPHNERDEAQHCVRRILSSTDATSPLAQMTYFDLRAWLPENTLVKSDKISMAHSVELRVPFLHESVVACALELPDRDKLRGNTGKWIARQALAPFLIQDVLKRRKTGFPIPLTAWMFNEWRDEVYAKLTDTAAWSRTLYRPQYIESLFTVPPAEQRRAARLLWTMFNLEMWNQMVYEPNRQTEAARLDIAAVCV